jgi:hypothetical protein
VELVAEADHGARVDPPRLSFPTPRGGHGAPAQAGLRGVCRRMARTSPQFGDFSLTTTTVLT